MIHLANYLYYEEALMLKRKFVLDHTKILALLSSFMLILSLAPTAQAANRMTATLPAFPVTVNGQVIDNSSAQYPLFLYKDITYVPMTYNLCRFLGLVTAWDGANSTFSLRVSSVQGDYVPDTGHNRKSNTISISRLSCNVAVNGVLIPLQDWQEEEYPLVSYNDIVYFPLTFSNMQNFGWESSWDAVNGLVINLTREVDQNFLDWESTFSGTPLE